MIEIILIAFGLSMDAFAVSITKGALVKSTKLKYAFKTGLFFGGFQAVMPCVGWFAGIGFKNLVSSVDHWIAFIVLSIVGIKMIYEAVYGKEKKEQNELNNYELLFLAIATSIDALAVGFTFAFLNVSILTPVVIIGIITFAVSFIGVFIGDKFGKLLGNKTEIAGGLILIAIGVKILIEHL